MNNTRRFASLVEVIAVMGLAVVLGACTSRSSNSNLSGTSGTLTCTMSLNPKPLSVQVDANGAIVGTPGSITVGISSNQLVQVMSLIVSRPAGLNISSFLTPSAAQTSFSILATPLDGQSNTISATVQNSAGVTQACSAVVTYSTTTVDAIPVSTMLRFNLSADVSGDSVADVSSWDPATGNWWVTKGNSSTATKWGAWGASQNWQNVTALDLNNDGKKDIVGRDINEGSGAWWAAMSTGSSFSNRYLGSFSTQTTWSNIQFVPNTSGGGFSVYGTDASGYQYKMNLNPNSASSLEALPPQLLIGVSDSPVIPGQIPGPLAAVPYNGTAYVSWKATGASNCSIFSGNLSAPVAVPGASGATGSNLPITNLTVNPTSIYLSCTGAGGLPSQPASAMVSVGNAPIPVLNISVPDLVDSNGTIPITWSAQNVTPNSCSIRQNGVALPNLVGPVMTSGPIVGDTYFVLTCAAPAPYGSLSKTSVKVAPASSMARSPANLSFGSVTVGKCSGFVNVQLAANQNDMVVTSTDIPGGVFRVKVEQSVAATSPGMPGKCGVAPFQIASNYSCYLPIQFCPSAPGAAQANLVPKFQTKGAPSTLRDGPVISLSGSGSQPAAGK